MVFAFSAYAVLFSLVKSAAAYAQARQAQPPESVDLRGIEKTHRDNLVPIGVDRDFVERARLWRSSAAPSRNAKA